MAITTRQTSLLVNQDWTKLYQTFKEANFQAYDFQTLRKSMIEYLQTYYPEDFNDFIESSEYIALIDMIAFLGQSLAFRQDLNARENFLDTAERRDSILKLARLISYNPKRNTPAQGYLKFDSVSTTESVTDSNGINLSNLIISWNDSTNENWQEQFNVILNSALISAQTVGKPGNSQTINGIKNDEYSISIIPNVKPVYSFGTTVEGVNMNFEAVSATSINQNYIYENSPKPTGTFNVLYRNDNLGNSSNNTGFFLYFKQGILNNIDFNLNEALPNRNVNINFDNINNTDVWLYDVNPNNSVNSLWEKVPAVNGVNVVYNKVEDRNLYQINTRDNDQVDLVFGDGSFTNIPRGNFRLYYRTSNGLSYKITPEEMQSVNVAIPYVSRVGRVETLTIRASLYYTVANSSSRESMEDIRAKAPQAYYTQDRMVTGEDYNILPYTKFNDIIKSKAVNRSSSGISRFLDVQDATGKYSSTNIFADDGWLYREDYLDSFTFQFNNYLDVNKIILNNVVPRLSATELKHFYYSNYTRFQSADMIFEVNSTLNGSTIGYFRNSSDMPQQVGSSVSGNNKYITEGAMLKLYVPDGYFDGKNKLVYGTPNKDTDKLYIYVVVTLLETDITTLHLNSIVPSGAMISEIIPIFKNDFTESFKTIMSTNIQSYRNFGVRYDPTTQNWLIINSQDLNVTDTFSFDNIGDTSGQSKDSSWIISFVYDGSKYIVNRRGLKYIFESKNQTKFYYDKRVRVYDSKTGLTINDQVKVLKVNSNLDTGSPLGHDQAFYIYEPVTEDDGYINQSKILITYTDTNLDGYPDNPDIFDNIVAPNVNTVQKYVYFEQVTDSIRFNTMVPIDSNSVVNDYGTLDEIKLYINKYDLDQVFYAFNEDKFYKTYDNNNLKDLLLVSNYSARIGRSDLYFQYRHNSPNYRRIDPSPNNIMDLYILTRRYNDDYAQWLRDSSDTVTEPTIPTNEELQISYSELNNYKTVSDTIIFNSASFKPIFGDKSDQSLRATFKVVKNPNLIISDTDVKTAVISAINNYFDINNWEFGETFYFSELSAYLHSTLTPSIASIVIVPLSSSSQFGSLYQINCQPNEIIVSSATVDNVEIISAITSAQLNH